jgi:hypothetical protein
MLNPSCTCWYLRTALCTATSIMQITHTLSSELLPSPNSGVIQVWLAFIGLHHGSLLKEAVTMHRSKAVTMHKSATTKETTIIKQGPGYKPAHWHNTLLLVNTAWLAFKGQPVYSIRYYATLFIHTLFIHCTVHTLHCSYSSPQNMCHMASPPRISSQERPYGTCFEVWHHALAAINTSPCTKSGYNLDKNAGQNVRQFSNQ